jgi:hypothetical protein
MQAARVAESVPDVGHDPNRTTVSGIVALHRARQEASPSSVNNEVEAARLAESVSAGAHDPNRILFASEQKGSSGEPSPPWPRREIGEALRQGGQVGDRTIGTLSLGGKLALQRRDVGA